MDSSHNIQYHIISCHIIPYSCIQHVYIHQDIEKAKQQSKSNGNTMQTTRDKIKPEKSKRKGKCLFAFLSYFFTLLYIIVLLLPFLHCFFFLFAFLDCFTSPFPCFFVFCFCFFGCCFYLAFFYICTFHVFQRYFLFFLHFVQVEQHIITYSGGQNQRYCCSHCTCPNSHDTSAWVASSN